MKIQRNNGDKENNIGTKWDCQQTEIIKKKQTEILELKNTITKLKNSLEDLSSRFELAEERISKLKDKSLEMIKSENQKQERLKKSKESLRTYRVPQVDQSVHYGNPRKRTERGWGWKLIWRNNGGWKIPTFEGRHGNIIQEAQIPVE